MKNPTTLDDHIISEQWDKYETPVREDLDFDYCYCQSCGEPVVPSYYPESKTWVVLVHIIKMVIVIALLIGSGMIWDKIQIYFN